MKVIFSLMWIISLMIGLMGSIASTVFDYKSSQDVSLNLIIRTIKDNVYNIIAIELFFTILIWVTYFLMIVTPTEF